MSVDNNFCYKIIFIGGVRDFHAMDWYHSLGKVIGKSKILFLTDSFSSEGLADLSHSDDNIQRLFVVDRFLLASQTSFANLWRNALKILFIPFQILILRKFKRRYPHAIFHAHPLYYLFLAWIARIECGVTPQGSEILVRPKKSRVYKYFLKKCLKHASFVTVDSISMKKKIFNLSKVTAILIQNGIDTQTILNYKRYENKRDNICSIRGLSQLYNIHKIIHNRNKTLPDKGIDFIYPFLDQSYYKKIKSNLIKSDKLIGKLEKKELYAYLHKCYLTISIPSSDSSPRSVYEAIFAGSFVAVLNNDYLSLLTPCMIERIIVVNPLDDNWFIKAVDFAYKNKQNEYIPSEKAIELFDQYRSMANASKLIYNI